MNIMRKNLLFIICSLILICAGNKASAASAPVTFTGGHNQYLPVCMNGTLYSLNGLLVAYNADLGETITWSVVTGAAHGTVLAAYSTASTGGLVYPVGLSYTPSSGYVGYDTFSVEVFDGVTTDTTTIFVTVQSLPNAGTLSGGSYVCAGNSITLTSTVSGGFWTSSNGNATVLGGVVTGVSHGVDTISYSDTNSCGINTAMQVVSIDATPSAGPITGATVVCVGGAITLTGASIGGSWSSSSSNTTVSSTGIVGGASGGTSVISYITSGACGFDTATLSITVDSGIVTPSIITGADTMCAGAMITLSNASAGGVWTNSPFGSISTGGVLTADSSANGADTVIYTLTNACGSGSVHHVVYVNPLPFAGVITGYDSVCAGSTITLHTTGTGGVWSSSIPEFGAVDANGHVTGGLNGTSVIRYTVTNACGSATATHSVRVNLPAQPIVGSNTICRLSLGILADPVTGGTWSSSNFLVVPVFGGNITGLQLGTATITYTVNNACGTSSATIDIEVVDCTNDVNEVTAENAALSLIPNPNTGTFTLQLPGVKGSASVVVTNVLGAKVKEFTMAAGSATEVNIDAPAGVYFLTATVNNTIYSARMVIAK